MVDINAVIFSTESYPKDITTLVAVFIVSILTTISGIGGGSLMVPLFMIINGFSINTAVPLSVATIVGSTIVRIVYFYNKEHPRVSGRSLIYYFPILIIVPFITNFSFLGIILADLMPNVITAIIILILLGYTFYKTLMNGIKKFRQEHAKSENKRIITNDEKNTLRTSIIEFDGIELNTEIDSHTAHPNAKDNIKKNITMTLFLIAIIAFGSVFSTVRKKYDNCGLENISLIVFQVVIISAIGLLICLLIHIELQARRDNNYLMTESDIIFSKKSVAKIIIISSLTGILATYIGIGGGSLIVPLMIHLGISPDVVVATGSMSALFTALISTINYLIDSKLLWKYALSYMASSSLGACAGILLLNKLVSKKHQSYIIFIVAALVLTSTVLLIINLIISQGFNAFIEMKINDICK